MLYGLALQAARTVGVSSVAVQQVIVVPAAGLTWARSISTDHPRRTWRQGTFSLDGGDVWNHSGVKVSMDSHFEDRDTARWRLTTDSPVLFAITDDEYREMATGLLPRNVALRYQRAIEAHDAVLLGAGARSLEHVIDSLNDKINSGEATISKAAGIMTHERVSMVLDRVNEAIKGNRTAMLDNYMPNVARAKGGGPHRNHDNLPTVAGTDTAAPAPAAPAYVAPAAPAVGEGAVKPGDVLIRPNGVPHVARAVDIDVKGMSDIQMYRRLADRGVNILLDGPPGTGKTAGFEVAFPGLRTMILSPQTESIDFYGQYVVVVGEDGREQLVWEDSDLVKAMEAGAPILLDEIGLAPANELSPLFPLMDGRRELRVPNNPARGTIKAKEGFLILGAYNPDSSRNISEALLSRFRAKITVNSDYQIARDLGVNPRLVDAAEHMDKQRQSGDMGWAPQIREVLAFKADEDDLGLVYALRNLINDAPEFERDIVEGHLRERFGDIPGAAKKVKRLALG